MDLSLHAHLRLVAQRRRGFLRQADQAAAQTRRVLLHRRTTGGHQPIHRRSQCGPTSLPVDQEPQQDHRCRQTRAPSVRFGPLGPHGCSQVSDEMRAAPNLMTATQFSRSGRRPPVWDL